MKKDIKDRLQKKIDVQKQTEILLNHSKPTEDKTQNKIKNKLKDLSFSELLFEAEKNERLYQFHTSIIQNMHSGLMTIDLEGQITFANKSCEKLTLYSPSELKEMNINQIFLGKNIFEHIISSNRSSVDVEAMMKNKMIIPIKVTVDRYSDEGNEHEGYILMLKDIREERLIMSQKQEMEKLTTLTEVSAGIAHELRNPLAGIKSISQVIEAQSDNPVIDDCIQRIIKEVDRANNLLQQFFKYAKPTDPKKQFENVDYIIERVLTYFKSQIEEKNITIDLKLGETTPHIFTDINQVEYCITQVISNAIDAVDNGGWIHIEKMMENRTVYTDDLKLEKEFVQIRIDDDGHGIEDENVAKIFHPFFTTHHFKTGLGLSISKRFIESNGGLLEYDPVIKGMTRFKILIPIH